MKTLHVVQHADFEGCGSIARWATARSYKIQVHHLYRGDPFPVPATGDALVLMGGPMNIYEYRNFPWLRTEREAVIRELGRGTKMLGVCLGAQIIADALGARVYQNDVRDIGWRRMDFVDRSGLPAQLPAHFMAMSWHGDTFSLPAGATHLARSAHCVNEGYLWKGQALGLQFHLEADRAHIDVMLDGGGDGDFAIPCPTVDSPDQIRRDADAHAEATHALMEVLLDQHFA